jgi:putative DNA primase/helicase
MSDLYELIRSAGITPAEGQVFIADDKVHRFIVSGKKKDTATYQLEKRSDGRIVGWVRDHGMQKTIPVVSGKPSKPLTAQERQTLALEREIKEAAKRETQENVAQKAKRLWRGGYDGGSHGYALLKKVPIMGARVGRSILYIPLYDEDDEIVNLQCINAVGEKRFLKYGKKLGCMGKLPPKKGMGLNRIYVVEGWATGVSVWLATGCAVAIAFDCGNLKNVVDALRERHPASEIIIAGDNDQWSKKSDGTPFNPGADAAISAGADYTLFPPFPFCDRERRTDWNDYAKAYGYEKLGQLLNVNG